MEELWIAVWWASAVIILIAWIAEEMQSRG